MISAFGRGSKRLMYANLNPRTMGLTKYGYEELLAAAARNGFEGIEVPAGAFETVEKARTEGARLAGLGMRWGLIMAPCDLYRVPDDAFEAALKQFAQWVSRARAAGCARAYNHIWPGSDDREYDANFEWHAKRLRAIYEIMDGNGMRYGLEFMGARTVREGFRHPFIHSLAGTMALADSVDRRIGFVFDTIHWYCSGGRMDDVYLAARNTAKIVNVHLNDADPRRSREDQVDSERGMPMEHGIIDSAWILRQLHLGGYDGPVIVEPMKPTTDRYASMPLDDAVADAASCLAKVFEAAGI
ncbi:MAG TPA: TIM barrel protein [Rectinemataceae bacterium]|nr:TIM barrel protein [Rectinemataceae bacterium]